MLIRVRSWELGIGRNFFDKAQEVTSVIPSEAKESPETIVILNVAQQSEESPD